jgi:hypothetical protein
MTGLVTVSANVGVTGLVVVSASVGVTSISIIAKEGPYRLLSFHQYISANRNKFH